MAKLEVEVSLPEAMRRVTLNVVMTGRRQAAVRTWLGCRIIKLGAWVIGCGVDITDGR